MKDYTKARLGFRVLAAAAVLAMVFLPGIRIQASAPNGQVQPAADFAGWHLPVPAGTWLISRGPCGSPGGFSHQCGYFEDNCAIDLTPLTESMLSVPVLAPQAGQVFFLGTRDDSGMVVMLTTSGRAVASRSSTLAKAGAPAATPAARARSASMSHTPTTLHWPAAAVAA